MASKADKQDYGEAGIVNETGTTAVTAGTGDFCRIQVLTAATFTLLTDLLASGDALTGISFPAGTDLRGKFTAFTLSAGAVRAYRSAPL